MVSNNTADTALAHVEIRNLYALYAHAIDGNDADAYAGTYTKDGLMLPNQDAEPVTGREAIRAFVRSTSGQRPRHIVLNLAIDGIDGDTARARALFLLFSTQSGSVVAAGSYDDVLAREADGAWRFREKRVTFLWRSPEYEARFRRIAAGASAGDEG